MTIYHLIVLILYHCISISLSVPTVCIGLCHCDRDIVDCSSLDLSQIPANIPNNTRILNLSDNEIETIDTVNLSKFYFLEILDLSSNIINHISPQFFNNVPKLRVLNLRKNQLSSIPNGTHGLETLEKLDLRSNVISSISVKEFSQLAKIRNVDISRNLISYLPIPTDVYLSKIEKLDLSSNAITHIYADHFQHFSSIISIRLFKNRLTSLIPYTFSRLSKLEFIDLSRNLLRDIRFLAFNQLGSLKNVTLAKNEIYRIDDGIFFGCDNLLHLNISMNRVQSVTEGWMYGLKNLQVLDLSFNQIQSFHTNSWLHTPYLRWLNLHSNRIQSLPSGSFRSLRNLQELILSANSIDSLHKFALIGMENLHSLDLSSNTLAVCVEDGAVLYNTSMPFLRSLRFQNNQLRVIPYRAFERFPALQELDITDNPIATIHPDAFEPLHLKTLIMNSSSLLCDCQFSWFSTWVYNQKLDKSTIIAKCSYPQPLQDLDVFAIDQANLTCMNDSPRAKIVGQPMEISGMLGEKARFTCNVYGEGPLVIEWRVLENGQPRVLVQDSLTFMTQNTTAVVNGTMDGREFAAADLILENITISDRLEYQCVARNRFGSDFSSHVRLFVYEPPKFLLTPSDASILVGQTAKFACAAAGTPRPELKWAFDGGSFPAAEARRLYVIPNDDHIYIMNVTLNDEGIYTCHASNTAGQINSSARLTVFDNTFRAELESQTVRVGESVVLDCFIDLIPGIQRMVWRKNMEVLTREFRRSQFSANDQIMMLTNTSFSDSGEYSCELWVNQTQVAGRTANVEILSDEDFEKHSSSLIYKEANKLRVIAIQWVNQMDHKQRIIVIISCSATLFSIFGICTFLSCYVTRRILRNRENPPVYV